MTIKVLVLSRYSAKGASSRLRMFQYIPMLQQAGMHVDVSPFFDDQYLISLYQKQPRSLFRIARSYVNRLAVMLRAPGYDLIWVEKECLPYVPAWLDFPFFKRKAKIVVDYDDAVFLRYKALSDPLKILLKNKIEKIMGRADLVVTGNDYLLDFAKKATARLTMFLPTVIDLDRYMCHKDERDKARVIVGWMGSPSSQKYLAMVDEALCELNDRQFFLHIVGATAENLKYPNIRCIPWAEETESADIRQFDIGIMPLFDTEWEKGKCGYKLIQYMACAKPVVASPVGVNTKIVKHGVNGFLANTKDEWIDAFKALADNDVLRNEMGQAGRKDVEESYCLQVRAPDLLKQFKEILSKKQ